MLLLGPVIQAFKSDLSLKSSWIIELKRCKRANLSRVSRQALGTDLRRDSDSPSYIVWVVGFQVKDAIYSSRVSRCDLNTDLNLGYIRHLGTTRNCPLDPKKFAIRLGHLLWSQHGENLSRFLRIRYTNIKNDLTLFDHHLSNSIKHTSSTNIWSPLISEVYSVMCWVHPKPGPIFQLWWVFFHVEDIEQNQWPWSAAWQWVAAVYTHGLVRHSLQ